MAPVVCFRAAVALAGRFPALAGVDLSLEKGEVVVVVGPNGAGKTSLLNCITGAYRANSGRISFRGSDITHAPGHTAARRGIARTFQHNELFPQLTTLGNLLLGRHATLNYDLISAGLFLKRCRSWGLEQREKVEAIIEFFRAGIIPQASRRRPAVRCAEDHRSSAGVCRGADARAAR